MRPTLIVCFTLLLTGCNSSKHSENDRRILDGTSDNASPIIVVDGSSIHFHQKNYWMIKDANKIEVDHIRPYVHLADGLLIGACKANINNNEPVAKCFKTAGNYKSYDLPYTDKSTWAVYLCDAAVGAAACTAGNATATIAGVSNATPETDITITPTQNITFIPVPNNGDGPDVKLANVHLYKASLATSNNGTLPAPTPLDTCPAADGTVCAIKILYCTAHKCAPDQ